MAPEDIQWTITDQSLVIDPTTMTNPFVENISNLLVQTKWLAERESLYPPMNAPVFLFQGKTHTVSATRLYNGMKSMAEIPERDYLKHDFDIAKQYDIVLDIAARTNAAIDALRGPATLLVWRSEPAIRFSRVLTPKGLLPLFETAIGWV